MTDVVIWLVSIAIVFGGIYLVLWILCGCSHARFMRFSNWLWNKKLW